MDKESIKGIIKFPKNSGVYGWKKYFGSINK